MTAAPPLEAAADLVRRSHRIVTMAHVNPDADAIGSILGLTLGLRALGKDATAALSDPVPVYASFLQGAGTIVDRMPEQPIDLLICADAADIERIGSLYEDNRALFDRGPILNIDHHQTNPLYGAVNYVVAGGSSTSELMYRLLRCLDAPVDSGTATALLFGLYGDTGSFQNGATTPEAMCTAAELVERGADVQRVAFQLFERKSFAAARLWGEIMSGITLDRERGIVFGYLSQKMLAASGTAVDETEGVAEFLRGIQEAEVVVLFKETPEGEMRVSMRSRPAVDVAAIAKRLGGGGHRQAAGCTIPGPVETARQMLVAVYDELNPR